LFASALAHLGVRVTGRPCRQLAPVTAVGVASVESPPVAALVQRMLVASDNDLAEALGRTVAVATGQPATFAGAATAVMARIRALGLDLAGVRLYDASGLSRLDRVTPQLLVQLLFAVAGPVH